MNTSPYLLNRGLCLTEHQVPVCKDTDLGKAIINKLVDLLALKISHHG